MIDIIFILMKPFSDPCALWMGALLSWMWKLKCAFVFVMMAEAMWPYYNIPLCVTVDWLILPTQSGHVLQWHSQSPEEELLFCVSKHFTLMQGHHFHHVDHNDTLLTDIFHIDLNADVTLVTFPMETVLVTEPPSIRTMKRQSKSLRSYPLAILV